MDNKIKNNINKLEQIFNLLDIDIVLDKAELGKKLSSKDIKLELESVVKNVENMKETFNEKLGNKKIFLTKDEYNKLFITYLKSTKISILEIQNLKYRKEYYDFYIRQDDGPLTTYEKLISKLDLGQDKYFENNVKSNGILIELKTIVNNIKKINVKLNLAENRNTFLSNEQKNLMENIFKQHKKSIKYFNILRGNLKKNLNRENYNEAYQLTTSNIGPIGDFKFKYKFRFIDVNN